MNANLADCAHKIINFLSQFGSAFPHVAAIIFNLPPNKSDSIMSLVSIPVIVIEDAELQVPQSYKKCKFTLSPLLLRIVLVAIFLSMLALHACKASLRDVKQNEDQ